MKNKNTKSAPKKALRKTDVSSSAASLTPQTANTEGKLLKLKRDNMSKGDFWILAGENSVSIARQKAGTDLEALIEIPKSVFNAFVEFYTKG
jgi:hypothetical protein